MHCFASIFLKRFPIAKVSKKVELMKKLPNVVRAISKYAPNNGIPPCQSKAPNDIEMRRQRLRKRYTMQTNINPESNDQGTPE